MVLSTTVAWERSLTERVRRGATPPLLQLRKQLPKKYQEPRHAVETLRSRAHSTIENRLALLIFHHIVAHDGLVTTRTDADIGNTAAG